MSTGVDQRGKGQPNQVANGPNKDQMKEEFDAYLTQPQQAAYNSATMPSSSTEPYMANYYASMTFPYVGQGMDNTAWSNGDPMGGFLGGYGQMNSEYMGGGGMFGGFGYQPGFSWDFSGGDYASAWGNPTARKDDRAYADGYYGMTHPAVDSYSTMNGNEPERDTVKEVEQQVKGLNLTDATPVEPLKEQQSYVNQVVEQPPPPPAPSVPAKKTWASIASQPAKPVVQPKAIPRAPTVPGKHNMDIGTWDGRSGGNKSGSSGGGGPPKSGGGGDRGNQGPPRQGAWTSPRGRATPGAGAQTYSGTPNGNSSANNTNSGGSGSPPQNNGNSGPPPPSAPAHPVLDRLRSANQYNPKEFNVSPKNARYFIIKSYSEDDIHRSIKYSIWCSTEHGNKRLDAAYREREQKGPVYLLYSVNGSGHFCGMAQMMSAVDYNSSISVWAQDKWKGQFEVKWIYVKDVPNSQLRHIKLENNENKPVTNSRDTQEVPAEKGKLVLKIMHNYRHSTSIFDDFVHYERRQQEDTQQREDQPPRPQERQRNNRGERHEPRDGDARDGDRDGRRDGERDSGRREGGRGGRGNGRGGDRGANNDDRAGSDREERGDSGRRH